MEISPEFKGAFKKPPLSWTILLTLLASRVLVYALFRLVEGSGQRDPYYGMATCLVSELAASTYLFLTEKKRHFVIVLVIRITLFASLSLFFGNRPVVQLLLALGILLEMAMYVSFPHNLLFCSVPVLLPPIFMVLFRDNFEPVGIVRDLALFLCPSVLFGSVACLVLRYREEGVQALKANRKLDTAVASLAAANLNFQQYAFNAGELSKSLERERITGEIHDQVGYCMTNLIMMLEAAIDLSQSDRNRMVDLLSTARGLADEAFQATRGSLYALRSQPTLERTGLSAIHGMVEIFRKATGMEITMEYSSIPNDAPDEGLALFFRVIQEGLTNAFRHGKATKVDVLLGSHGHELTLVVRDNGQGAFDVSEGIGMAGMRKRVMDCGGEIWFETKIGFTIRVQIPFQQAGEGLGTRT